MTPQTSQVPFPFACQRWRDHRGIYCPPTEVIRTHDYEVAPISLSVAKNFVAQHHYLGSSYPACRFRYGLYLRYALFPEDQLVGVAVFSMPMSHKVLTNIFPCDVREAVELGRFVLLDSVPANAESFFFARCRELLQRERIKGIVAFSDDTPRTDAFGQLTFKGHIGTIYQSSNASYYLRSTPRTLAVLPDGSVLNPRSIAKIRKAERGWRYAANLLVRHGATEPPPADPCNTRPIRCWLDHWTRLLTRPLCHPGNHRYAWSIHPSITLPPSAAYPKWPTATNHTSESLKPSGSRGSHLQGHPTRTLLQ